MTRWEVAAEVRSVQAFIFESDRLAQMRGASRLLSLFDTAAAELAADHDGVTLAAKAGYYRVRFDQEDFGRDFGEALRSTFRDDVGLEADRLAVTEPYEVDTGDARTELNRVAGQPFLRVPPPPAVVSPCEVCGLRPAEGSRRVGQGTEAHLCCAVCLARYEAALPAAADDLWHELGLDGPTATSDRNRFASGAQPENYLATLVADGNQVGECFRRISDDAAAKGLSERLGAAVHAAVRAAAEATVVAGDNGPAPGHNSVAGLIPDWVGGDDLVLTVHPQHGLRAAEAVTRVFADGLSDDDITISVGVVIAHASHPFPAVHALGDELLKSAKAASVEEGGVGTVDFEFVSESVAGLLPQRRAGRRRRPFPVPGSNKESGGSWTLGDLLERVEKLRTLDVPRGQIRNLDPMGPPPKLDIPEASRILDEATSQQRLEELRDAFELVGRSEP